MMPGLRRVASLSPFCFTALLMLGACSSYKQNVMFSPTQGFATKLGKDAVNAERNYVIQVNDQLKLEVFSNKGERIIDPNGELLKNEGGTVTNQNTRVQPSYLVTMDGTAKFPMIAPVKVEGLTIRQGEVLLQEAYDHYYKECYVILTFNNKRVVILGSVGGQVIPLVNENVRLVEVLALAKGIGNDGKAHNIRLIRGEDVYLIDLTKIEGFQNANMIVQPNDVIYVEPIRRPFVEGFRDIGPVLSLIVSITTLVVVVFLNNNTP